MNTKYKKRGCKKASLFHVPNFHSPYSRRHPLHPPLLQFVLPLPILQHNLSFCSGRPSTAELVGFVAYTDSFQNTLAGKSKNRRFYFLEKQGTSEFVRRLGTLSKSLAIFFVCRDMFERFLSFSEIETPVFRFCSPVVCFETNLYTPRIRLRQASRTAGAKTYVVGEYGSFIKKLQEGWVQRMAPGIR